MTGDGVELPPMLYPQDTCNDAETTRRLRGEWWLCFHLLNARAGPEEVQLERPPQT